MSGTASEVQNLRRGADEIANSGIKPIDPADECTSRGVLALPFSSLAIKEIPDIDFGSFHRVFSEQSP